MQEKTVLLSPGAKQYMTGEALAIVDVIRNMGVDGVHPGDAIVLADLGLFRAMYPSFTSMNGSTTIQQFMLNKDIPGEYYVYPPAHESTNVYVEIKQAKMPATILWTEDDAWKNETIPLSDKYADAYLNGMLAWAYNDDSDIPGTTTRSEIYYARFLQSLGLKVNPRTGARK